MTLPSEAYDAQARRWPREGRHILAHFDDESIVVYQAYRPSIGRFALANGYLGGDDFSLSRMSWIKPNFLWMMYRSGWGMKPGQEIVLGLRLRRPFFDRILAEAVSSSFDARLFADHAAWQTALAASEVRLQWDPDHGPTGAPLDRKAIQLGLRGRVLADFARAELLQVIDMTELVRAQRPLAAAGDEAALMTPVERVYVPASVEAGERIGLAAY